MSNARLALYDIWEHESTARKRLASFIAKNLNVGEDQVSKWANKKKEVPLSKREALLKCIEQYRWRSDPKWRLTLALAEALGGEPDGVTSIDNYIVGGVSTEYKLARFDGHGKLSIGAVTVSPSGEQPYWWSYKYSASGFGNVSIERHFEGPIVSSGKCILALLVGGKDGEEPYARAELMWPMRDTQTEPTYGVSLSTFLTKGMPIASPFALISLTSWNNIYEGKKSAQADLENDLRSRSREGIIIAVP